MTLLRFLCPVCETEYQVPDANVATSSPTSPRVRCAQCGWLFVPNSMPPAGDSAPRGVAPAQTERASPAPQPPSVIYAISIPQDAAAAGDAASGTRPVPGAGARSEELQPPHPPTGPAEATRYSAPVPSVAHAPDGEPPKYGTGVDHAAALLGPPPPYRPIVPASRPAPPRAEIAPIPPAAPINIRGIGAFGLPPPYRPILQAGQVFERGPAPDLEPWRRESLVSTPAGEEPVEDEWSLPREPDPDPAIEEAPWQDEERRFQTGEDFGARDRPLVWPAGTQPPHAAYTGITARLIRPMLWAAGIGVSVLVLAVALDTGRDRVMRNFPPTVGIYDALGLASNRSSAAPGQVAAPLVTGCAAGRAPGLTEAGDGQVTDCENINPPALR